MWESNFSVNGDKTEDRHTNKRQLKVDALRARQSKKTKCGGDVDVDVNAFIRVKKK